MNIILYLSIEITFLFFYQILKIITSKIYIKKTLTFLFVTELFLSDRIIEKYEYLLRKP
jgi:hypothetical protein